MPPKKLKKKTTPKKKSIKKTTPKKKSTKKTSQKKLSKYQEFMKKEIQRLKDAEPNLIHTERFKKAASNWKMHKEKN